MMNFRQNLQRISNELWYRRLNRPYKLRIGIETGKHGEPLVMLHGLGSSGLTWRYLAKRAAGPQATTKWHVVAPDLLGFGSSPKPDWYDYDVEDHTRVVLKFIRQTFGSRPVTIVAHSLGCLVAIRLASQHPKRVKRLILYEPPLLSLSEAKALNQKFANRPSYQNLYKWVANKPQMLVAFSRLLAKLAIDTPPFQVEPHNLLPLERTLRNTIIKQQSITELEQITIRTDIAYGRFDFIVDNRSSRKRLQHNPHIHFHQISDTHGITRVSSAQLFKILNQQETTETPGPA